MNDTTDPIQDRVNAALADMVGKPLCPATICEVRARLGAIVADAICNGDVRPDSIVDVERNPHDCSKLHVLVRPGVIDEEYFTEATGAAPENDDLERANCDQAGALAHYWCGWCPICNRPRVQCGHQKETT